MAEEVLEIIRSCNSNQYYIINPSVKQIHLLTILISKIILINVMLMSMYQ